jgi:hypothetical protein
LHDKLENFQQIQRWHLLLKQIGNDESEAQLYSSYIEQLQSIRDFYQALNRKENASQLSDKRLGARLAWLRSQAEDLYDKRSRPDFEHTIVKKLLQDNRVSAMQRSASQVRELRALPENIRRWNYQSINRLRQKATSITAKYLPTGLKAALVELVADLKSMTSYLALQSKMNLGEASPERVEDLLESVAALFPEQEALAQRELINQERQDRKEINQIFDASSPEAMQSLIQNTSRQDALLQKYNGNRYFFRRAYNELKYYILDLASANQEDALTEIRLQELYKAVCEGWNDIFHEEVLTYKQLIATSTRRAAEVKASLQHRQVFADLETSFEGAVEALRKEDWQNLATILADFYPIAQKKLEDAGLKFRTNLNPWLKERVFRPLAQDSSQLLFTDRDQFLAFLRIFKECPITSLDEYRAQLAERHILFSFDNISLLADWLSGSDNSQFDLYLDRQARIAQIKLKQGQKISAVFSDFAQTAELLHSLQEVFRLNLS